MVIPFSLFKFVKKTKPVLLYDFISTILELGSKSLPTVARFIALGSLISFALASLYHLLNKSKGLRLLLLVLLQLYYLLINESSRVIALGIDQVSDDKKQSFFNRLEDPVQKNEIIMEIGNLDNIPLEAVVTIAKDLQQKVAFLPAPKKFSRGGGESMAKILSQMDADEAQQYLDQIQGEDPDLYEAIKQYYLTFDDLLEMPEHLMKDFWMSPDIDPDVLARALRSYDEETVNAIIEFLPKRKQAMFTPIDKPIAKKEIRTSRANLVTIARKMVDDGEFSMDDIFGQEELE